MFDALQQRLTQLEQEVAALRAETRFRRRVDLIEYQGLRAFFYADDLIRQVIDQRLASGVNPFPSLFPNDHPLPSGAPSPLLATLFRHYQQQQLPFAFLDIGCHYGLTVLSTARILRALGLRNPIFAFDPGVAATLAPHNFALNGIQHQVIFEPVAVSNQTGPCLVYSELGHSQDNRIVNRIVNREVTSYPVRATSLDAYVNFPEHLIVKIDTQGAEKEVLEGMSRLLAERQVTILTEFTPHALQSRIDPASFLQSLLERFHVLDIGDISAYTTFDPRIPAVDPEGFIDRVNQRSWQYTDLLLLPRKLPAVDSLLRTLTNP